MSSGSRPSEYLIGDTAKCLCRAEGLLWDQGERLEVAALSNLYPQVASGLETMG